MYAEAVNRLWPAATPRRPAGFTLIELTIVLVVLGISAGLAIPALSGLFAREGEKSMTRVLAGVLRRARSEAVLSGRSWRVDIDWARGECRLSPDGPPPVPVPLPTDSAARTAVQARTPAGDAAVDAALAPRTAAVIPPVRLPDGVRPRLSLTPAGGSVIQPETASIVVRPEGLCQPAFFRLPDTNGQDAAVSIAAVGCRVTLATSDLDTAQARFQKNLGLADPPWAHGSQARGRQ
ncbi:pilus assembly FimT family protein [Solidesulfovibrio sp.]